MVLSGTSCIKESYDMNTLSKDMHLSPTFAISAVKGDVAFSDIVKANDTIVFDQNYLVTIVFKRDSVLNLNMSDFVTPKSKINLNGTDQELIAGQLVAPLKPFNINLGIDDILKHMTGEIHITNPLIRFSYINSFRNPIQIAFNANGKRGTNTVALNPAPFNLLSPVAPAFLDASSTYIINKTNSSIDLMLSLPPAEIDCSGSAIMTTPGKSGLNEINALTPDNLIGSVEVEVPVNFHTSNLQFSYTVENFLKDNGTDSDNPVKPENFDLLRVDFSAKNGFPLGVSLEMILYDSKTNFQKSVKATDLIQPAPVDNNGKASSVKETETVFEFTKDYFSSIPRADSIIFKFTLVTTDNGTKDVKIYSDNRINFKAALVWKPDIILK
jgi:hypothetical protein